MKTNTFKNIFFKETFFTDFYFFNVGYEKCDSAHSFGPTLREHYIIHFITSGKGVYKVNNKIYPLTKGDFFIIKPNELTYYEADSDDPWEYYWFGFSGIKANDILTLNGIQHSDYTGEFLNYNSTVYKTNTLLNMNLLDDRYKLTHQSTFMDIFSNFKLSSPEAEGTMKLSQKEKYKESFLLYVHNNYHRSTLSINEIARSMYLNPSYFSQVIKEELRITARTYLRTYRLEQAKQLLRTTQLTINEVALAVGYDTRHSFSRAFKNKHTLTPTAYKNELTKKNEPLF